MADAWKKYEADFNGMTDADIEAECDQCRDQINEAEKLADVWEQAQKNHERFSATGSDEDDIRFFALGLVGEAGEVANFIKKRWRDGDSYEDDLRKECADVLAYLMMLAWKLGMTPQSLIEMVGYKQQVFIEKMEALQALREHEERKQ